MWVVNAHIFVLYCERHLGSRFNAAMGIVKKSGWSVSWQDSNWEFPNTSIYLIISIRISYISSTHAAFHSHLVFFAYIIHVTFDE